MAGRLVGTLVVAAFLASLQPVPWAHAQGALPEAAPPTAAEAAEAEEDALVAALAAPWVGDLDGIIERGYRRVGVPYGPPFLVYDGADQQGISVDLAAELEKHLRRALGRPARTLTVALAPLPRQSMFDALTLGVVDLLVANLTVTEGRAAIVDFADPILTGVAEIVVTGPAAPAIASLDDLAASEVHVRRSSSYFDHLGTLNASRTAAGAPPIPVVEADENLEDFDLLELVDVGVIPAVVVDSHKAALYEQVFEHLVVHPDLTVNVEGEIAWAMRKDSPMLMEAVNGFMNVAHKGTELGNILFKRWLTDADRLRNAMAPGEDARFAETIGLIQAHADSYGFDPILIAAQGYQESRLDQSKRSDAGAVGIMQVMPATAGDPNVAIADIHIADRNVEAGVKYLRFLRDHYFSDPAMSELDQTLFSFAAYNAGPGNIARARRRAEAMGLDPDVWFGNVELAAARAVSREPVIYVRNILKYYVTYRLFQERAAAAP